MCLSVTLYSHVGRYAPAIKLLQLIVAWRGITLREFENSVSLHKKHEES
jgi:hypothetical protein